MDTMAPYREILIRGAIVSIALVGIFLLRAMPNMPAPGALLLIGAAMAFLRRLNGFRIQGRRAAVHGKGRSMLHPAREQFADDLDDDLDYERARRDDDASELSALDTRFHTRD
jgi:hypothetical protein